MLWQLIVMNWWLMCCFSFVFRNDQPVQDEEPTHDSYRWVILLSRFFIVSIDAGVELIFCPMEPEKRHLFDNSVTGLAWWWVCSLYQCHTLDVMVCTVCTTVSHAWCDVVYSLYNSITCLTWWCVQFVQQCHMSVYISQLVSLGDLVGNTFS